MTEALEQTAQIALAALRTVWLGLGQPGLNPLSWNAPTWVLASLGLVILALLGTRTRPKRRAPLKPKLLISKGSLEQMHNSSLQELNFTISNLGDTPVQLLELALQTSLSRPVLIEAVELIAPYEAVELEAPLADELAGDVGKLHVFAYTADARSRIYSLQAKLVWEPWHKRFKVSPTGQRLRPTRQLTSARLGELRKRAWLEQNPHLGKVTPPTQKTPPPDPKKTGVARRRKTLELDFPKEF